MLLPVACLWRLARRLVLGVRLDAETDAGKGANPSSATSTMSRLSRQRCESLVASRQLRLDEPYPQWLAERFGEPDDLSPAALHFPFDLYAGAFKEAESSHVERLHTVRSETKTALNYLRSRGISVDPEMDSETALIVIRYRGRDTGHPAPPAQIRTCGTTAYGSYLG